MDPTTPGEIEEQAVGHALVLGVVVGIPLVIAAIAIVAMLTGAGVSTARRS
jgi:hypothetical protein